MKLFQCFSFILLIFVFINNARVARFMVTLAFKQFCMRRLWLYEVVLFYLFLYSSKIALAEC